MSLKFSVITVTYNCAETLERTIGSVLNQKYPNIEYIIIDGNSTDGTKKIIEKYSDKLAYWVSEKDDGIYNAMNKGITKATGDIISFINGDDSYCSDMLFNDLEQIFKTNSASVICGRVLRQGHPTPLVHDNAFADIYYRMIVSHQGVFAKREIFDYYGKFDEQYEIAADYEWILRTYAEGVKYSFIDMIIADFALGGKSASGDTPIEVKKIALKYAERANDSTIYHKIEQNYRLRVEEIIAEKLVENKVPEIQELLQEKITNKSCYIWGTGFFCDACYMLLQNNAFKVKGFFDNSSWKIGTEYRNLPVLDYRNYKFDAVIVISSYDYADAISKQLSDMGLESGKDYVSYKQIISEIAAVGISKYGMGEKYGIS